jgi:hypothetical protein
MPAGTGRKQRPRLLALEFERERRRFPMPTAKPTQTHRDDLAAKTSGNPQAIPVQVTFDALGTLTRLTRDLLTLSFSGAGEALRLSVEANDSAVEGFRAAFGQWAFPGVPEIWQWWQGWGIGTFSGYAEILQGIAAQGSGETEVSITVPAETSPREVDVRESSANARRMARTDPRDQQRPGTVTRN